MSDRRLRVLERGSVEVKTAARYLWERVRVGELSEAHLELAAYAGHPPARMVLGLEREPRDRRDDWAAFHTWVWGLGEFGHMPEALATAAIARLALRAAWLAAAPMCDDELPRRSLEHVEHWLRTEGHAAASAAQAAFRAFAQALSQDELAQEARGLFWLCHDALEAALSPAQEGRLCRQRVYRTVEREGRTTDRFAVAGTSDQITAALIDWALRPPTSRAS